MAQTKRKRRRKHRGTQGGSIDRRGRGRPRSREEARAQARRQAEDRRLRPPSWGSAFKKGLVGALVFLALMGLLFGSPFGEALALSGVMLLLYIPTSYYMDRFFYRRRRAAEMRERQQRRGR